MGLLARDLDKAAWEDFQKRLLGGVTVDDAALDQVTATATQGAAPAEQVAASAPAAVR